MNAIHIHIFEASGTLSLKKSVTGFIVVDDSDEFKGNQITIIVDPRHHDAMNRAIAAFNLAWTESQTKEAAE